MTDPSPPAINAVLAALDRLADDLRRRAEEAESRAAAAEERAALERQAREAEAEARHGAEARAAVAEQGAQDAIRRAEAADTAAREGIERLRRDLLDAIQEAVAAAQAATAVAQAGRPGPIAVPRSGWKTRTIRRGIENRPASHNPWRVECRVHPSPHRTLGRREADTSGPRTIPTRPGGVGCSAGGDAIDPSRPALRTRRERLGRWCTDMPGIE